MKTETLQKVKVGLGILGAVGTAAGIGSWFISTRHPETDNLPSQHVVEIKKIVGDVLDEREKNKS